MRADQIIIKPILSEKSNLARESECRKYTFAVNKLANKFEIMDACKALFNVDCVACNTMNVGGKPKFSRGKGGYIQGSTPSWKKAIVTLAKGQSISAIDNI